MKRGAGSTLGRDAIEVAKEGGQWVVRFGRETLGAFSASDCAVACARTFADAAAASGSRPRIIVELSPSGRDER